MTAVSVVAILSLIILFLPPFPGKLQARELEWGMITNGIHEKTSVLTLAIARLAIAVFVFAVDALAAIPQPEVLTMFTNQTWTFIGIYFLLSGGASLASWAGFVKDSDCAGCVGFVIWVLFEIMLAVNLLVWFVVWFVLIPVGAAIAYGKAHTDTDQAPITPLGLFCAFTMHNANIVLMAVEAMYNRLVLRPFHCIFAVWYGTAYVVFSWWWFQQSGTFWYFFIDWRSDLAVLGDFAICFALMAAFGIASRWCQHIKRDVIGEDGLIPEDGFLPLMCDNDEDESDSSEVHA